MYQSEQHLGTNTAKNLTNWRGESIVLMLYCIQMAKERVYKGVGGRKKG